MIIAKKISLDYMLNFDNLYGLQRSCGSGIWRYWKGRIESKGKGIDIVSIGTDAISSDI